MLIFLDTPEIEPLKAGHATGLVDGVTTNPSLIAKSGRDFKEVIAEICGFISGPVSAEVAAMDAAGMIKEGKALAAIADNVVVKLPLTVDGLKACYALTEDGIDTNVTLCFSAAQALLAAKAGASFISPFIGRLDDLGQDGMELIHDIRDIYDNYGYRTKVLAASIRSAAHVKQSAMAGADAVTIPPKIFDALYNHPLTDKGLTDFVKDWQKTGQSIV